MSNTENNAIEMEKVHMFSEKIAKVREELAKDVVGQSGIIDNVIIAIVAGGNVHASGGVGLRMRVLHVETSKNLIMLWYYSLPFQQ